MTDPDKQQFALALRAYGVPLRDVARLVGVSHETVRLWEQRSKQQTRTTRATVPALTQLRQLRQTVSRAERRLARLEARAVAQIVSLLKRQQVPRIRLSDDRETALLLRAVRQLAADGSTSAKAR